jgi:hypothetical protein
MMSLLPVVADPAHIPEFQNRTVPLPCLEIARGEGKEPRTSAAGAAGGIDPHFLPHNQGMRIGPREDRVQRELSGSSHGVSSCENGQQSQG